MDRFGRVSEWFTICDNNHEELGRSSKPWESIPPVNDSILIDVTRQCLVKPSRYLALSYVLRETPGLATTKDIFHALCVDGALKKSYPILQIPRTILDAIYFTESLGIDFLWVDRLCIVQDDDSSKNRYINAMGAIYANAYITIIASNGTNAEYGLLGIGWRVQAAQVRADGAPFRRIMRPDAE